MLDGELLDFRKQRIGEIAVEVILGVVAEIIKKL